jgi:outer membrane protein OmpA-like peptidoglycan-associated protein
MSRFLKQKNYEGGLKMQAITITAKRMLMVVIAVVFSLSLMVGCACPPKQRAEIRPEPEPKPVVIAEPTVVEKVILLEDVHFDLDKSTLTPEAQTILRRNIEVLKENPNMKLRIQGHTSAIASDEYNQKLSERRAKSVEEFLIKEGPIAPNRLSKIGYGETRLEKAEPNPELKESAAAQTNRRVIFKIVVK